MDNFATFTHQNMEEKRHRKKTSLEPVVCPICGVSLRENELEIHYKNELEKLSKIKRTISKSPQTSPQVSPTTSKNVAGSSKADGGGENSNLFGTFQRIKENRVRRTSKVKKVN